MAEAAGGGAGGSGGGGGGTSARTGPTLQPNFLKMDKLDPFYGDHNKLDNFIFSMRSYLASTNASNQVACRYLVSHLKGDALTWWRTYCEARGGINQVFTNLDLGVLIDDLCEQFTDVDK